MTRLVLFTAFGVAGCSKHPAEPPPIADQVVLTTHSTEPSPRQPQQPTEPVALESEEPPVFEYPNDRGGAAVVKAVAPRIPMLASTAERNGAPRARQLPQYLIAPAVVPSANSDLPPLLLGRPKPVFPVAPLERVPVDLGILAGGVPAKPTFPVTAGISERAADVKLPPTLPILGRQLADRVSLDDPTSEFGNSAITTPSVKVTVPPAGFVKVSLPDPFELRAQVKPNVPPSAEPALSPVQVNPQRVK